MRLKEKLLNLIDKIPWFPLGALGAFGMILPYLVLGRGVYIPANDQLDGEVINYIYNARYWGGSYIPEVMGGVTTTALTPPSPAGVLLYRFFDPMTAFAVMHSIGIIVGYVGMFFLLKELISRKDMSKGGNGTLIPAFVAAMFVYLPFYPVYGLSVYGQPLVVWALLRLYRAEKRSLRDILYLAAIALCAVSSSLALVGFAWIGVLFLILLWNIVRKKGKTVPLALGLGVMVVSFVATNIPLISEVLGLGESYVSHRTEMTITEYEEPWDEFINLLFEGGLYVRSFNRFILALTLMVLLVALMAKPAGRVKISNNIRTIVGLLVANILIAVLAILWKCPGVAVVRDQLGGMFRYFAADRIYWLLPLSWYVILALDLKEVWNCLREKGKLLAMVETVAALLVLLLTLKNIYIESGFYHNLHLMLPGDYYIMTWDQYYATDLYPQVAEIIRRTDGLEKDEYRVVSLGVNPAAALYNGFYTCDGYSNNYPLEYKHSFRQVIAPELDKSDYLRWYFDEWGNRCYLFNSESGDCMTVYKNGGNTFKELSFDSDKLLEMGGRYVISALPVENFEDLSWEPVIDEPVTSALSYYSLYIYRVLGSR